MAGRLLLDTNLLVLLVVGATEPDLIVRHKGLSAFDEADFETVLDEVNRSSGLILAPHILAETSNIAMKADAATRKRLAATFADIISRHIEHYVESRIAVRRREYPWLGLTDSVLLELAEADITLWTADAQLYVEAARAGKRAVNYNHIREQRPSFR